MIIREPDILTSYSGDSLSSPLGNINLLKMLVSWFTGSVLARKQENDPKQILMLALDLNQEQFKLAEVP